MKLHAELTLDYRKAKPAQIFATLAAAFRARGFTEQHNCATDKLPLPLIPRDKYFGGQGWLFACDFGPIAGHELDLLAIDAAAPLAELDAIVDGVVQMLNAKQGFVHLADYYHWQNAEQPMQYELAGKDHSTLPKVDNGLPPPLRALWIDISRNPGRRFLRQGFQESVASPMWLRNDQIGEIQIDRLLQHRSFEVMAMGDYFRIRHSQSPFCEDSGADQEFLRRVCFGPAQA